MNLIYYNGLTTITSLLIGLLGFIGLLLIGLFIVILKLKIDSILRERNKA